MGSVDPSRPAGPVHVALLAFPFGTHAAPLLAIGRALAAAAPAATFSFLSSAASNAALARSSAGPLANLRFYDFDDGTPAWFERRDSEGPEEEVRRFMAVTPANFRVALAAAEEGAGGRRVSCVVSDAFLWMAGELAAEMGAKWVALSTGGPASLAAHLHSDLICRTVGVVSDQAMPSRANETLDFIPALAALRIGDLPEGLISGDTDSVFACLVRRMAVELPHAAAVVLNTFLGLDPLLDTEFQSRFKSSLPVGPLNLLIPPPPAPDRHDCLPWLDRHPPASVAYVSFGTVACLPPAEMAALAAGLECSGAPFLWSLKEEAEKHLPTGFLDRVGVRGRVVPWAPQAAVLGHVAVGAFVTHCGWNSVTESLVGGVPMVCRPFFGDQRVNARVASDVWGIGVEVGVEGGALTCDRVAAALEVVLGREEGRKMRKRARELREMAVDAVGPGGSSAKNLKTLVEIATGH